MHGLLEGDVHAALGHGARGRRRWRAFVGLAGKQPHLIAMRHPVLAQHGERLGRQGHVAVFGPFAAAHVDHHPLAVDVADLEPQTFVPAQAEGVERP